MEFVNTSNTQWGTYEVSGLTHKWEMGPNQEIHHKERNFREEFLLLLQKHAVKYDEKYLWK